MKIFKKGKSKEIMVYAPCGGKIIDITEVEDEVFSQKFLGDGVALLPTSNEFYAPMSGKLIVLFPTGHAFGIQNAKVGIDLLIHIGLETINSKENLYKKEAKINQTVSENHDLIVTANIKKIKDAKYDAITPIIVTTDSIENHKNIKIEKYCLNKNVKRGDLIFKITI